jgi:hypothetical protein
MRKIGRAICLNAQIALGLITDARHGPLHSNAVTDRLAALVDASRFLLRNQREGQEVVLSGARLEPHLGLRYCNLQRNRMAPAAMKGES